MRLGSFTSQPCTKTGLCSHPGTYRLQSAYDLVAIFSFEMCWLIPRAPCPEQSLGSWLCQLGTTTLLKPNLASPACDFSMVAIEIPLLTVSSLQGSPGLCDDPAIQRAYPNCMYHTILLYTRGKWLIPPFAVYRHAGRSARRRCPSFVFYCIFSVQMHMT